MAEREPTESPEDLKPANVGRGFRMAGGQRLALTLAAVGMLMAACTTTGEIEGHKVRGTAAPETPVEQAAREFNEHWAEKIGPMIEDDPQVQEAVREILAERAASENPGDLHASAPPWFRNGWARYLRDADGRYAVLAVDRNARGWGYVFCRAADCHLLEGNQHKSHKDLRYKQKALELCRGNVREYQPAHRPDCAVYAIKDKIVWTGAMPWE